MAAPSLSPEECYQRALKALDGGQVPRAIKLLKIARLKDPADPRFLEALHQAQAAQRPQQLVDTIDPQALLVEARTLEEAGDIKGARQLLQIALARAPRDKEIRAAVDALRETGRAPPPPEATEEQKTRKALSELATAARDEVTAPPSTPAIRPAAVSRSRLIGLFAALVLAIGASGGIMWATRTSRAADPAPYAAFLPVRQARAVGVNSEEVVLVVSLRDWKALGKDKQHTSLQQALTAARAAGHVAVFVYDEERTLLGSANPDLVYVR